MSYDARLPFSDVVQKSRVITSGATTQMITRVPWQPGSAKSYHLRKMTVASTGTVASASVSNIITLWDQDLSSATPTVRGNASTGALFTLAVPPGAGISGNFNTAMISTTQMPRVRFEAGVSCQATLLNTAIMLELEMY